MNKFFKQKSKYEIACYFIAALSIITGEAIKDILHNTVALEIGHSIFWFCLTIAAFAMSRKRVYKKVDTIICVAALVVIAIIGTFFTMKGLYALAGAFAAALLCNLGPMRKSPWMSQALPNQISDRNGKNRMVYL